MRSLIRVRLTKQWVNPRISLTKAALINLSLDPKAKLGSTVHLGSLVQTERFFI